MSKEIEAVAAQSNELSSLSSEHIMVTNYGVEFDYDHKPNIDEWYKVVSNVQKVHGMMQFYLGDLMVFADSEMTGWGQSKYDDLIKATGYDYGYLRKITSIARRFNQEFRKNVLLQSNTNNVTFSHFELVAPLDSDEHALYFLQKVAEGRWTVAKLREEIERQRNRNIIDAEDEEGDNIPTFVQVTKEMATWARNYAKDNNADFIRIQVIKGDKVIEEKTTEVY